MLVHSVKVTEDGKKALIDLARGDMRKVLNILQSAATAFPEVNEDSVYTCVGHPLKSDIMNILKWLLNDDFASTFKSNFSIKIRNYKIYNIFFFF
jgi:replication factor C subunit 3/5